MGSNSNNIIKTIRKKSVATLILIFLLTNISLMAFNIGTELSIRSPKTTSEPLDYEFSVLSHSDSLYLLEVEFERQDGVDYRNLEAFLWRRYKFLGFTGKYINIQEDDLEIVSVDMTVKYKSHGLGLAEVWNMHPSINVVWTEDIRKSFGIPYLFPVDFMCLSNTYTNDFKEFNNELEIRFTSKLSSVISIYMRYKQRWYDEWNFSGKVGIELNL